MTLRSRARAPDRRAPRPERHGSSAIDWLTDGLIVSASHCSTLSATSGRRATSCNRCSSSCFVGRRPAAICANFAGSSRAVVSGARLGCLPQASRASRRNSSPSLWREPTARPAGLPLTPYIHAGFPLRPGILQTHVEAMCSARSQGPARPGRFRRERDQCVRSVLTHVSGRSQPEYPLRAPIRAGPGSRERRFPWASSRQSEPLRP